MQSLQLTLSPEQAHTPELLKQAVAKALSLPATQISHIRPVRKSIDARGHFVKINLAVEIFTGKEPITSSLLVTS